METAVRTMASRARLAAQQLASSTTAQRNAALTAIRRRLEHHRESILAANRQDIQAAEVLVREGQLGKPLLKRLNLGGTRFTELLGLVESVSLQPDPLGVTQRAIELDEDLKLFRVSVPIGVIGVIFESRPDALVQIASLCLKSGNAVLLKGGREAAQTNQALAEVLEQTTAHCEGIPPGWIGLLADRAAVRSLLALDQEVDLVIPRGSNEFVRYIMNETRIPVLGHADGICHVYVDRAAELDKAVRITVDAKTQYVAVCNAAETLLIHRDIAAAFLARALPELQARGVELRGDPQACSLSAGSMKPATEQDWRAEYLDYILAVRVVDDLDQAIEHINHFGSHHTDAIVTEDRQAALRFLRGVDSASVMHNASTRFADGFRYGLGAEVGISTSRLHSRGPVGLEGLTIYKYILEGNGQIVDDYEGKMPRTYTHRRLNSGWPD